MTSANSPNYILVLLLVIITASTVSPKRYVDDGLFQILPKTQSEMSRGETLRSPNSALNLSHLLNKAVVSSRICRVIMPIKPVNHIYDMRLFRFFVLHLSLSVIIVLIFRFWTYNAIILEDGLSSFFAMLFGGNSPPVYSF